MDRARQRRQRGRDAGPQGPPGDGAERPDGLEVSPTLGRGGQPEVVISVRGGRASGFAAAACRRRALSRDVVRRRWLTVATHDVSPVDRSLTRSGRLLPIVVSSPVEADGELQRSAERNRERPS